MGFEYKSDEKETIFFLLLVLIIFKFLFSKDKLCFWSLPRTPDVPALSIGIIICGFELKTSLIFLAISLYCLILHYLFYIILHDSIFFYEVISY